MSAPQQTPAERLALSRERLRVALARHAQPQPLHNAAGPDSDLLAILKAALPGTGVLIDLVGEWWKRQPLHTSGLLSTGLVQNVLRPLAQRNPIALAVGAVVVGVALAWSRPWRWIFQPQLLSRWGPTVLSSVLASAAVRTWLATVLAPQPEATASAPTPTPPPESPPAEPTQESVPTGL
jgi:hypothetical protein